MAISWTFWICGGEKHLHPSPLGSNLLPRSLRRRILPRRSSPSKNAPVFLRKIQTFRKLVDETLRRHYKAVKTLTSRGTYFFDYGNAFMRAVFDAGVTEIAKNGVNTYDGFIWPSYVEDIMGPLLFDYGYGPFRWVCLSGDPEDLRKTDQAAMDCIDPDRRPQTGTIGYGFGMPPRTVSWWEPRRGSFIRMRRDAGISPCGSTPWYATGRSAPS